MLTPERLKEIEADFSEYSREPGSIDECPHEAHRRRCAGVRLAGAVPELLAELATLKAERDSLVAVAHGSQGAIDGLREELAALRAENEALKAADQARHEQTTHAERAAKAAIVEAKVALAEAMEKQGRGLASDVPVCDKCYGSGQHRDGTIQSNFECPRCAGTGRVKL